MNSLLDRAGLSPDDEANPNLSDLLWWPEAAPDTVIVVEALLSLDPTDVVRAHRRTETLKTAGLKAAPVVVGRCRPTRAREPAARPGVERYIQGQGPSQGLEITIIRPAGL